MGTLLRLGDGGADLALVIAQPTAKSMEVARRGLLIAASREVPAILIANRVARPADERLIRDTVEPDVPVFVIPDDPLVARADEEGTAPYDAASGSPGVAAVGAIADHVARVASALPG